MKYLLVIACFSVFLAGCGNRAYSLNKKMLNDRNSFEEKPLVVPPLASKYPFNKESISDNNYDINLAFQLVFNENYNQYNNKTNNLEVSSSDIDFLNKANANNDLSQVRVELDKESLGIIAKNNRVIHKILFWQVNESIKDPKSEYIKLN